ncbi:MAG: insulinase family protein [Bacteroidales bacterium]|nr:insulinase family protein [Bacteroidales bacterium]
MVRFERFTLENGLRVIVHEDRSTPLAAMNLLYNVGSRREDEEMTGLAHLLEHLMFGGSANVPEFDLPLQIAGGENNAFTNNDITDYYITIPAKNLETAFWLESDRMTGLNLTQETFDIQKSVVIEEFKQRYLNQPYGDAMLKLRPLAYKVHPYKWPTIGMDISHIENVSLEDVKKFYSSHYSPGNAILSLTGNISPDIAREMAEKWFGPVESNPASEVAIPVEPEQTGERIITLKRDVPSDALYKAWHICKRDHDDFHALDLVTDILAGGESGRLYTRLVRKKNIFSEINVWITSDLDPGLAVLTGKLMKGVDLESADRAVNEVIDELKNKPVSITEINKVKNRFESSALLSNTSILNKAMSLSFYELLGDAGRINSEVESYRKVGQSRITDSANRYFATSNCSTIYYQSTLKT